MNFETAFLALVIAAFGLFGAVIFTVSLWSHGGKTARPAQVTPAKRPAPTTGIDLDIAA